ncbi:RNA-directed DNA polymerase from mobile element jockey [Nosema granulosis]|uniref:RNA-directed DNA polymerase from mobile element jockey n=1 Tax=Nosema granulosis TaxID=83296 RepID=A0A9P6KXA7_9MICR|nr:RNA-directed DNA polymerase from mobile element jockey [Nosema granulosis]
MLSVTVKTSLGDVVLATAYVPPRTGYLHYPDFHALLSKKTPTYFLGDLNARHMRLDNANDNTAGRQVIQLIDRGYATHEGPFFPTYITHRSKTSPDIILANSSVFHNTYAESGPLTPSDHIPIMFTISTSPIQIPVRERTNFVRADWDKYREILRKEPTIEIGNNKTEEEIEQAVTRWTHKIQEASRQAIPRTS